MKKMFLYISIGIIVLAIPITIFVVGKNSEVRKRAAPASTLSFNPASLTKKAGETFSLEIKIDTASNQVGTVQLRIVYDPAFLEAQDISNGPLAPSIRVSKKIDPDGKISITVGARDTTHPITGIGTVAVVTMKAIAASVTPISVKFTPTPDTNANAIGEGGQDVIVGRAPATITILNADGSSKTEGNLSGTPASTPTPTFAPDGTASNSASISALLISSPSNNEEVATGSPTIQGKAAPGSTVTVVIHSDTQTDVVSVDANGNWIYKPKTPLAPGLHTIQAMITDPVTGQTQTITTTFVVAGTNDTGGQSTPSAIPVSGNTTTTMMLLIIGTILLISGALVQL